MAQRPDWDYYFIGIAAAVAQRATWPRAFVGAVLVKNHRIIATGYNGAAAGERHCIGSTNSDGTIDEGAGCLTDENERHCQRAIHAETNAISQAAKFAGGADGCTMYFWDSRSRDVFDCTKCSQIMKASGIISVINRDGIARYL